MQESSNHNDTDNFIPNKILITQPRRVQATSISKRVLEELKWKTSESLKQQQKNGKEMTKAPRILSEKLGETVGYKIRFEDLTDVKRTKILFATDGMALQIAVCEDPLLTKFKYVILDECHERSIPTDLLLGLIKNLLESGARPDLKVIVMSQTLNVDQFMDYFGLNEDNSDSDVESGTEN